jgi:hypothetical protein
MQTTKSSVIKEISREKETKVKKLYFRGQKETRR